MKKTSVFLLIFLVMISLSWGVDKRLEDTSGLFAVEINGKWGYINTQGNIAIQPQFEEASFFSEGLARVKLNSKWGFISENGNLVIPAQFNYADCFSHGLSVASYGERFGYIDRNGKWTIPAQFSFAFAFSEGLARVESMGRWRFIQKNGQFAFPGEFEDANDFSEGAAAVLYADKWGFIDRNGHYLFDLRFDDAYEFQDGWAVIDDDGLPNFVNKKGELFIKDINRTTFLEAHNFSEGLADVRSVTNGKIGYINQNGNFVITPKYDLAFLFRDGLAAVSLSGQYGFIDKTGKEVIGLQYKFTEVFIGGLARVKTDDNWIYIDRKGKIVWPKNSNRDHGSKSGDIQISYSMAGLTSVIIQNGRLQYMTSEYRGNNPHAAGGPDDYIRSNKESSINDSELKPLLDIIHSSGFLRLKDTCGAPDSSIRHYPVRITIKTPQIEKNVLFRSNPDYQAPPAFKAVEKALLQLAQKKTY